jgi:hypothetical protein
VLFIVTPCGLGGIVLPAIYARLAERHRAAAAAFLANRWFLPDARALRCPCSGDHGDTGMMCKACTTQLNGSITQPHSHLRAPGSSGTRGYSASPNQQLFACSDCKTVLLKGRNTGWSLATKLE